jgi:hypothetical protein
VDAKTRRAYRNVAAVAGGGVVAWFATRFAESIVTAAFVGAVAGVAILAIIAAFAPSGPKE